MVTFLLFLRGCLGTASSLTSSTQFTEQIYSTKAHNKHQTSPRPATRPSSPVHPTYNLHLHWKIGSRGASTRVLPFTCVVETIVSHAYGSHYLQRVLAEKNSGRTPTRQAKKLREKFLSDNEGEEDASTTIRHGNGSVERVLKMAAESIGRSDLVMLYAIIYMSQA